MTSHAYVRALERHGIKFSPNERATIARWLAEGDPRVVLARVRTSGHALVAIWLRGRWLPVIVTPTLTIVTVLPDDALWRYRTRLDQYRLQYNLDVQRAAS